MRRRALDRHDRRPRRVRHHPHRRRAWPRRRRQVKDLDRVVGVDDDARPRRRVQREVLDRQRRRDRPDRMPRRPAADDELAGLGAGREQRQRRVVRERRDVQQTANPGQLRRDDLIAQIARPVTQRSERVPEPVGLEERHRRAAPASGAPTSARRAEAPLLQAQIRRTQSQGVA